MKLISETRKGQKQRENEDHLFIRGFEESDRVFFGVADGIGSHDFGGSVAKWISKFLLERSFPNDSDYFASCRQLIESAFGHFVSEFADFHEFLCCGCTLSVVAIQQNSALLGWVGDSPIFHIQPSSNRATRVTNPHASSSGVLTSCFKGTREPLFEFEEIPLNHGDWVVALTDGVVIDELDLLSLACSDQLNSIFIDEILEQSVSLIGSDDATIVCCQF